MRRNRRQGKNFGAAEIQPYSFWDDEITTQ